MWIYGISNRRDFLDKHLFYVLFVIPAYVHVAVGSTFSGAGMGLVPVNY